MCTATSFHKTRERSCPDVNCEGNIPHLILRLPVGRNILLVFFIMSRFLKFHVHNRDSLHFKCCFRNAIFNFVNIAFNHGYIVHFNQLKTWILSRSLVFLLVWNGQDGMSVEVAVLFLYESLFTNGHMLNGRKLMLQKDYNMQTFCLPHFISVQSCSLNKKYNVKCFCFFLIIGLYWSYWIRLFYDASDSRTTSL